MLMLILLVKTKLYSGQVSELYLLHQPFSHGIYLASHCMAKTVAQIGMFIGSLVALQMILWKYSSYWIELRCICCNRVNSYKSFYAKSNRECTQQSQCSGSPPYSHPVNTATSLLRLLYFFPAKSPWIFLKENPFNSSFATTWQGGHVGGQYKRNFFAKFASK